MQSISENHVKSIFVNDAAISLRMDCVFVIWAHILPTAVWEADRGLHVANHDGADVFPLYRLYMESNSAACAQHHEPQTYDARLYMGDARLGSWGVWGWIGRFYSKCQTISMM